MELIITARSKTQEDSEYTGLNGHGLHASVEITGGTGSAQHPFQAHVQLTNLNSTPWLGVIHVELPFAKADPRFFLPAFMYGRNRGKLRRMFRTNSRD